MGVRLTEDEAWAELAAAHTGILTTLRRDGRPVPLPVWFVALDRHVYVRTPARTRKVGGTGLGLAIVKHVVSRHHGVLEVKSEVGKGSIFSVYLPVYDDVMSPDFSKDFVAEKNL